MNHEAFYATVAGLVPVLALAFVIEARETVTFFVREDRERDSEGPDEGIEVVVWLMLAFGAILATSELAALYALSEGIDEGLVRGLLTAFVGLCIWVLLIMWVLRLFASPESEAYVPSWFETVVGVVATTIFFAAIAVGVTIAI